jgi:hypothetical protein
MAMQRLIKIPCAFSVPALGYLETTAEKAHNIKNDYFSIEV